MLPKVSVRWSLFIVILMEIAIPSFLISVFIFGLPVQGSYKKPVKLVSGSPVLSKVVVAKTGVASSSVVSPEQENSRMPSRLKIPKIRVNAGLESVGVTPQGAVGVPQGAVNAAWFNLGPRPGDIGSAVITGHYGRWKNGVATVFNNLSKLKKGDKIYVENKKGSTTVFIVRELRTYGPKDDVTNVFNSSDGQAHLNLITCEGVWDKVSKSYSKRLVVFTDKEKINP